VEHGACPIHPDAAHRADVSGADYAWGLGGAYRYARCTECDTLALDPRPASHELGPFYARYYDQRMMTAYRELYRRKPAEAAGFIDVGRARACIADQAATGTPLAAGMRVLDVGCGPGAFIRFLGALTGAAVRGVDFDPACRAAARDVHGVEVDSGTLVEQRYQDASFDLATSHHCLEHVADPAAELRELARIVRPGGFLHLEVPTRGLLGRLFGGRWAFLQPPTHFFHYRPATLRTLVERAGFEVLAVRRPWLPGELAFSLLQLAGIRGVIPAVTLPASTWRERATKAAFGAALVVDVPVTAALAALRVGGVVRIIARRNNPAAGAPGRQAPE
jgi:SAM-dependent methyltransferase